MKSNGRTDVTQGMEEFCSHHKGENNHYCSVISGLHRDIFKACARDYTLASMQMVIFFLAFEFDMLGVYVSGALPLSHKMLWSNCSRTDDRS